MMRSKQASHVAQGVSHRRQGILIGIAFDRFDVGEPERGLGLTLTIRGMMSGDLPSAKPGGMGRIAGG